MPYRREVGAYRARAFREAAQISRPAMHSGIWICQTQFLAVGDTVVQTERGELLWSVKETGPGQLTQIDKVTGRTYRVPLVAGSKCTQDGKTQTSDYCHQCHVVTR